MAAFRANLLDLTREALRLRTLATEELPELMSLAVDRILDLLPEKLGRDSWRSILTTALTR